MRYALLVCAVLALSACYIEGSAGVAFMNKSQHDIENIWGAADDVIPLLRPGESVVRFVHWLDNVSSDLDLRFYINGKVYGTRITDKEREEAGEAEGYRFKSSPRMNDGDSFTVTVYSDLWWAIKEN
ncbi:MAG: hypothetical protein LBE74_02195 [Treponema sp.]|jgi:hypothetical protein|nr:hypothetical protein [Treponema sp.]